MRSFAAEKEVPDNTVFWSTIAIVTVFVVVLATVMVVRSGTTGNIVLQYTTPTRPFAANPYACLDVPACGSEISFMCCAEQPMAGTNRKCTAPLQSWGQELQRSSYDNGGAGNPVCPSHMPNRCPCPEKFQYRQSWPVPSR
jgi:hypothetical protein